MVISKITTRNRHVYSNNPTKHDGEIGYNSIIEIDSHSHTHCFGKNFRIVSSTEQLCSVSAFLDELATTNNVAIVGAATTMIDNDGTFPITVFGQEPNFTKKMYKFLINNNKYRAFGV